MSRLGKVPVAVPKGVEVSLGPDMKVTVQGPKGRLELDTKRHVALRLEGNAIHVDRFDDSKESRAYHGLYQRLLTNMVRGVTQGFQKELEIHGVGYRAAAQGRGISLLLGYSHPIQFNPPEGITLEVPQPTQIIISGCDRQAVGQVAANLRAFRKPEPYKGKGIRYKGEHIRRKVGKASA